ncbi:hypothetical protein FQA39_LY09240 [Lamprigera yunnana]|nr:hypothetical protein FQA39_LY09240 [Lamprigera yunnana]
MINCSRERQGNSSSEDSKKLHSEYKKSVKTLASKGSPIKVAKVDMDSESSVKVEYKVSSIPALKFFKEQESTDYNGPHQAQPIVVWAEHNAEGKGKNKNKNKELYGSPALIRTFNDVKVNFNSDKNLISARGASVIPVLDQNTQAALGSAKHIFWLFMSGNDPNAAAAEEAVENVMNDFKDQIFFCKIDTDQKMYKNVMHLHEVKAGQPPLFRILKMQGMAKYKPDCDECTEENARKFVEDYLAGKLKRQLKGQPCPADWDKKPVQVLVASNYDQVVNDPTKNVLVDFYAPWCGPCKQLAPAYEKVGEKFKGCDDVIIAKMDADGNEVENCRISGFPTIKLFTKGNKKGITYSGSRTTDDFVRFVNKNKE